MNVSDLTAQVRSIINEASARLFTDAEILRYLNLGYADFVNKAQPCENVLAYAVVANQARYAKPSNALLMESILWEERFEIVCQDMKEFRARMYLNPTVTGALPMNYCEYPGFAAPEVQLWPIPSSASQSTTLSGGITSSDTTITVASTSNFPRCGWLIIESEQIWYNDLTSTQFLQCERGKGGTTAASHSNGVAVKWGKLTMRYTFMPTLLSASSDSPLFPVSWHEALALYASKLCFEKMGNLQQAGLMMQQYEGFIQRANNVRESRNQDRPFSWSGWEYQNYIY